MASHVFVLAIATEARQADGDEARVEFLEDGHGVEAEFLEDSRTERVDEDVGLRDEG
jgi:hypothetical protein